MKAILFFVSSGKVRESHRIAAKAIADASNKKVVFRNGTTTDDERAEACEGVAGEPIPPQYKNLPHYDAKGKVVGSKAAKEAAKAATAPDGTERELNAIGLPVGDDNPDNREDLKAALEAEGIDFHGNAKTEALVALYMGHFYPEQEEGEEEEA